VAPSGDDAQRSGDLSGIAISAGTTSPTVDALVIDDAGMLEPHLDAWDHLAVLRRQPYSAPAWMLAWWRQAAPRESRLRVVVVRDGGEVVGIAAWHQDRLATGLRVARLLGTGHRVEPLALPGHEATVARAVTAALGRLPDGPGALSLDRADAGSAWPGLLAAGRGSAVVERETTGAPVVRLDGRTWTEWLATRSRNFRSQRAQGRRRLAEHGAVARLAEKPDAIETAVDAFLRLTAARWNTPAWNRPRGGGIGEMLREAARDLVPRGRMRIWVLVADGTPLSVQLFLGAGDEWSYWNGGFDRRWARLRPGFETLVHAIEHACAMGDRRVDLGGGAIPYKHRLADADEPIVSALVLPGGADRPLRQAQLVPRRLNRLARRTARRAPPGVQRRLRGLRGRLR
jgi:CelD/BcsL family acetyltransferase involved in cellulose biosynthesis